MGLVLNKPKPNLDLNELRNKLKLSEAFFEGDEPIYDGGPVENGRGFVLHSNDQMLPDSLPVGDEMAMSVHLSMINEIAAGTGPLHHRIMLGYAGWDKDQLEQELRAGMWFHMTATMALIFDTPSDHLWERCYAAAGYNAASLSPHAGSA